MWNEVLPAASGESRGPPRFTDEVPANKLPANISVDLKHLMWNEAECASNNLLGSRCDGSLRQKWLVNAQKKQELASANLRAALEANAFCNSTILQIKRQALAAGEAALAGSWLLAAQHESMEAPRDMETKLWTGLVVAARTASVSLHFAACGEVEKASRFQDDYDQAWAEIEEPQPSKDWFPDVSSAT
mmetsp:Transcript_81143/g.160854  ORF Transcript_81143/g.160854 Transcript_81143/m.160854 type:complete len:189 (+) Transcript_81143:162-728(+)